MPIGIDKNSDVPLRRQIVEQIVLQIATRVLKPGDELPSVREIALRHQIHANTVSQAYQELVDRHWVKRHRGRKMVVRAPDESPVAREEDLDDLIDATIRNAREKGYSLQELRERVRERLLAEPPDHVPVVTLEDAMGRLIQTELSQFVPFPVDACRLEEFSANRGPAIGALVVCMPGVVWDLAQLLPRGRALVPLEPSKADEQLRLVHVLERPSLIAIASISPYFLTVAAGVLAPFVGSRHTMERYCLEDGQAKNLRGADLVFCDSITASLIDAKKVVPYRIVLEENAAEIVGMIEPHHKVGMGEDE